AAPAPPRPAPARAGAAGAHDARGGGGVMEHADLDAAREAHAMIRKLLDTWAYTAPELWPLRRAEVAEQLDALAAALGIAGSTAQAAPEAAARMTDAEAFPELSALAAERDDSVSLDVSAWAYRHGERSLRWSVWSTSDRRSYYGPTAEAALAAYRAQSEESGATTEALDAVGACDVSGPEAA